MQTNNKLREALEELVANIEMRSSTFGLNVMVDTKTFLDAKAALAEPVKNCEVGTVDEQIDRMLAFCGRKGKCTRCENHKIGTMFRECTLRWAQMPYEEGKNDGSK